MSVFTEDTEKAINAMTDIAIDHARLKEAVVAAAREYHSWSHSTAPESVITEKRYALSYAVDALKEFEAEHGIQEETQGRQEET